MPCDQALGLARDAGLDLVEVSPNESPPVCRIMDYGRSLYEKKKRMKMSAQSHQVTLKEIRLRPKTDPHDRSIKMARAVRFLSEGNKVQFTMLFRGRERFHREVADEIFKGIVDELGESIRVDQFPSMHGRRMTMVVSPGKKKPTKAPGSAPKRTSIPSASAGAARAAAQAAASEVGVAPTEPTAPPQPPDATVAAPTEVPEPSASPTPTTSDEGAG